MNAKNKMMKRIAKTMTANIAVPTGPKWCLDRLCLLTNHMVTMPAIAQQMAAACQESKEFKTLSIGSAF
jgi:hypothetical protein